MAAPYLRFLAALLSCDVNTGRRALWNTASRGRQALLPLQTDWFPPQHLADSRATESSPPLELTRMSWILSIFASVAAHLVRDNPLAENRKFSQYSCTSIEDIEKSIKPS
jgi:hypothetical protein